MREQCASNNTLQQSAMMYGLGEGCDMALDSNGDPTDLDFHLPSFLLLRGPFAWLGWAWVGCSGSRGPGEPMKNVIPPVGPGTKWDKNVLNTDYGIPSGTCAETVPGVSGVFTRECPPRPIELLYPCLCG